MLLTLPLLLFLPVHVHSSGLSCAFVSTRHSAAPARMSCWWPEGMAVRQADAALYRAMWELAMDDVLEVSHRKVRVRVGANTDARGITHAADQDTMPWQQAPCSACLHTGP